MIYRGKAAIILTQLYINTVRHFYIPEWMRGHESSEILLKQVLFPVNSRLRPQRMSFAATVLQYTSMILQSLQYCVV